ncbi:MAG: coproporphyrinogen III oxidase [Syntrophorhabdaceae bacterium PtaU1.Bin034]|nr:MAG: coproporphyrinogen III oxidase [Syntrophorhabdaceae bacterium PtaU1.Bin034]
MPDGLQYEIGPIRPPSEAYSLLVRFTRNCPWNKCEFCHLFKGSKFERRPVAEIKEDIDTIKKIQDEIRALSWQKGDGGKLSQPLIEEIFASSRFNDCFRSVAAWMYFGGKYVFIQDGNSLVMKLDDLVEVLHYLTRTFPTIDRITSYGRSQTIAQLLSVDDLRRLREAGLTRLHLGMESGSDFILKYMRKGVTKEQHIIAGQRVKESGIELSEYIIPGLGGKKWWQEHALESADALNRINPDFIRLRTLKVTRSMLLYKKLESGDFIIEHDEEILKELRLLIEHLEGITSYIKSDHILNLLEEVDGKLPEDREKILSVIDRYFELSPEQRLVYRMGRRAGIYRSTDDLQDELTYARVRKAIREMEEKEPGSVERHLSLLLENYI